MSQRLLLTICLLLISSVLILAQDHPQPHADVPQQPTVQTEVTTDTVHQPSTQTAQAAAQKQPQVADLNSQNKSQITHSSSEASPQAAAQIPQKTSQPSNDGGQSPSTPQATVEIASNTAEQAPKVQSVQPQTANTPQNEVEKAVDTDQKKAPSVTQQNHLDNLTQEQKAKLLHEESIRAQLHANQQLSLSKLANITAEQQQSLEQKLKIQARAAYQRAKKQQLQMQTKQKEELKQLLRSQQLSFSQQVAARQRLKQDQYHANQHYIDMNFNDYMFDMDPYTEEDFMVTVPVAQPLGYQLTVYENHDGVYLKSAQFEQQDTKKVKVYENHNSIVLQSSFYVNDADIFNAKGNSTYTFRFINSKQHILVMLKLTHAVQTTHLESKITVQDINSYSDRSRQLYDSLSNKFYGLDTSLILQVTNRKTLSIKLQLYTIYTVVQILIFIVLVLVQIQMTKRLLGSSSIV